MKKSGFFLSSRFFCVYIYVFSKNRIDCPLNIMKDRL